MAGSCGSAPDCPNDALDPLTRGTRRGTVAQIAALMRQSSVHRLRVRPWPVFFGRVRHAHRQLAIVTGARQPPFVNVVESFVNYDPDGPTFDTGIGSLIDVRHYDMFNASVEFTITSGGSYALQGTVNGTRFTTISGFSSTGIYNFGDPANATFHSHVWLALRVNVTTAGTDDIIMLGAQWKC